MIGENGAGKTTLVKLLARLYDPTEARSCWTAWTCANTTSTTCASEIGVIFQDYMRYDMMVRENIGLGRIERAGEQARIERSRPEESGRAVIDRLAARLRPDAWTAL